MASAALVRTLRGLTLRMADPELSPAADVTAAIKTALPLLLAKGRILPLTTICRWKHQDCHVSQERSSGVWLATNDPKASS